MQRILQSFKDLFFCDNVLKRHLYFCLLMLLPAMAASFVSLLDKETPKEAIIILLVLSTFFFILSIVPMIFSYGFYIDFCKLRLSGEKGIPMLNSSMFMKGLRYFPIILVWSFYFLLILGLMLCAPIFFMVHSIMSKDPISIVLSIILFVLFGILLLAIFFIVPSFVKYIEFNFAKDLEYKAEYFNPLTIVKYIKKSFASTMMVMLKFILVNLVTSSISSVFSVIWALFYMGIIFIIALLVPAASDDKFYYSTGMMIFSAVLLLLPVLVQFYITTMTSFAATDNYIDVYKKDIEFIGDDNSEAEV